MSAGSTQQTGFRLPIELVERLDAYAEQLRKEQPGMTIRRADVVRLLLTRALDELDAAAAPKGSGLRKRQQREG